MLWYKVEIQVALGYSFWWWNFYIQLFTKKLFWAFRPCNQYLNFTKMNWLKCLKGTYRQLEIQFQTKRQLFEKITSTSKYFILTGDNKGLIWTAHNESPGHDQIWWISDHTILYLFTSEISALVFCLILVDVYITTRNVTRGWSFVIAGVSNHYYPFLFSHANTKIVGWYDPRGYSNTYWIDGLASEATEAAAAALLLSLSHFPTGGSLTLSRLLLLLQSSPSLLHRRPPPGRGWLSRDIISRRP